MSNPYEYRRYRCSADKCGHVYSGEEALKEDVPGPSIRYSCPACYGYQYETFIACVECLQRKPVSGDDLCAPCLAMENDRATDLILEEAEERIPRREVSSLGYRRAS